MNCNYSIMTIVTRRENLKPLKNALQGMGVQGMTVTMVEGYGQQKAVIKYFQNEEEKIKLLPKVMIEVCYINLDDNELINKVRDICHTGIMGDGKIFIEHKQGRVVRIRNGEENDKAMH